MPWVAVVITGRVQEAGEAFENALVEAIVLDSLFCLPVYIYRQIVFTSTFLDGCFD